MHKLAPHHPDYVKIWYIVPPLATPAQAGDAAGPDDSVARAAVYRPVVHAVVEESHARHLRVAVHATELEAARNAVEEGADLLVHSVTDKPVDPAFVRLLKSTAHDPDADAGRLRTLRPHFCQSANLTPEEQRWGNPEVIATLDVTKLPADKVPDRIKKALADPDAMLAGIQKTYDVALKNLKTLEDAGITIAAGTDAGNIGTIHAPSLFREFQLMKEAGLTSMQILQSTTVNAAKTFGGETGAEDWRDRTR